MRFIPKLQKKFYHREEEMKCRPIFNPFVFLISFILFILLFLSGFTRATQQSSELDQKVKRFLESNRYQWHYENISEADGKVLYDLVIKNNYKRALEIGTSTGHSATWIAWALSKTGGKLITIEIDEERHKKAVENFKEAGLSDYIDARLADAHQLVPKLQGPFDFVFVDADKDWYANYLKLLLLKLDVGGCFTAHNVSGRRLMRGIDEFLEYLNSLPEMETTIDRSSWSGISISYKRAAKSALTFLRSGANSRIS
jgi:caffeoyl-CoA O-methyltransferase